MLISGTRLIPSTLIVALFLSKNENKALFVYKRGDRWRNVWYNKIVKVKEVREMPMEWELYEGMVTGLHQHIDDPEVVATTIKSLSEDYASVINDYNKLQTDLQAKEERIRKLSDANTELTLSAVNSFAPPDSVRKKKESDELRGVTLDMIRERKLV